MPFWTTTLRDIMSKIVRHWVSTITLLIWKTTPNFWKLSSTGSMKFLRITMMSTLSPWHKSFNGFKIQNQSMTSRTLIHGRKNALSIQTLLQLAGFQMPANWHQRKFPARLSTCRRAFVAPTTSHGFKIQRWEFHFIIIRMNLSK